MKRFKIFELVGDRGSGYISVKNYAFTLSANPMSDRMQKVIVVYESD